MGIFCQPQESFAHIAQIKNLKPLGLSWSNVTDTYRRLYLPPLPTFVLSTSANITVGYALEVSLPPNLNYLDASGTPYVADSERESIPVVPKICAAPTELIERECDVQFVDSFLPCIANIQKLDLSHVDCNDVDCAPLSRLLEMARRLKVSLLEAGNQLDLNAFVAVPELKIPRKLP